MRRALDRRQFAHRDFQLWAYVVSHQRLMLRSPKSEEHPLNIDLHFGAVGYIDLPTTLRGLALTSPRAEEVDRLRRQVGSSVELGHIFVLESAGRRHFVVAWSLYVEENDLGFMETPVWTASADVAQ
jgi:hypothetical protein